MKENEQAKQAEENNDKVIFEEGHDLHYLNEKTVELHDKFCSCGLSDVSKEKQLYSQFVAKAMFKIIGLDNVNEKIDVEEFYKDGIKILKEMVKEVNSSYNDDIVILLIETFLDNDIINEFEELYLEKVKKSLKKEVTDFVFERFKNNEITYYSLPKRLEWMIELMQEELNLVK
jgi:hypothetical protein